MKRPVRALNRPVCASDVPPARRAASAGSSHARSGSISGRAFGSAALALALEADGAAAPASGGAAEKEEEGPASALAAGVSRGLVQVVSPVCAFQKYQALALSRRGEARASEVSVAGRRG